MTKQQANEIKKVLKENYFTLYQSKKEQLRVRVYTYINDCYDEKEEKENIIKLLNKISANGYRPQYEIERRTYQGFIHDTNIIFK